MNMLGQCLAIGFAGFIGALARYAITIFCGRFFGAGFPVGTMVINLSGSFILGWFATGAGTRLMMTETTRLAIAVGFIGSFTTFSTLMYDSTVLAREGAISKAIFNLLGSLLLGLMAVYMGMQLARK